MNKPVIGSLLALALISTTTRADTLIVSNRGDSTVRFFDTTSRAQVAEVDAGVGAHEFAVSPDGRIIVGSCYGSGPQHQLPDRRLLVLDLHALDEPRLIDLGDNPRPNDLRFLPDSDVVLVTSEVRAQVLEVDVSEGAIVERLPHGELGGHMLALSPDGTRVYVPCVGSGKVKVIDRATDAVVATIDTAHGAEGVDISPDGKRLWVACNRSSVIKIIDTDTHQVVQTIEADGFPFRVRCTPDGKSVVVSHPMANQVRIYNAADGAELARIPLEGGQPTSIALSPDGARAYIVCGAVSRIAEIDLNQRAVSHWYETGPGPDAIAVSPAAMPAT